MRSLLTFLLAATATVVASPGPGWGAVLIGAAAG